MKYLCLDFGGTGVKYAIIDENFQLYDVNKENKIFQSHDEMITWVVDLFKTIHMKLSGIAISYCGEMNPFTGLIKNGGSYRFNDNKNIKQILWSKCHVPVSIENDGNCAALAELYRGSLKETSNGAVLVLGTGVVCAIIINGELNRGCNYFAGAATFSLIDSKHDFDWQNTFGLIGGVGYLTRNYEKRFALERNSIDGLAFFNKANNNDIASLEIHPVGTTLLEALESNNVPVVAACRAGVCGCCKTKVISGEYTVSSTMTLTDAEIAEGYVLACSCHPQGDLVLA